MSKLILDRDQFEIKLIKTSDVHKVEVADYGLVTGEGGFREPLVKENRQDSIIIESNIVKKPVNHQCFLFETNKFYFEGHQYFGSMEYHQWLNNPELLYEFCANVIYLCDLVQFSIHLTSKFNACYDYSNEFEHPQKALDRSKWAFVSRCMDAFDFQSGLFSRGCLPNWPKSEFHYKENIKYKEHIND